MTNISLAASNATEIGWNFIHAHVPFCYIPTPPPPLPGPLYSFCDTLVPRVFLEFKIVMQKRPWQSADHMTIHYPITKPAADLKRSKSPIFLETCDLLFARVFSELPFWLLRRSWGRGWCPGTPVFPSSRFFPPQKPTFPNSNLFWVVKFQFAIHAK